MSGIDGAIKNDKEQDNPFAAFSLVFAEMRQTDRLLSP